MGALGLHGPSLGAGLGGLWALFGRFQEFVEVAIVSEIQHSLIYYTTDQSIPTRRSTLFQEHEPIFIDKVGKTIIKAFAVHDEYTDSDVTMATYVIYPRPPRSPFSATTRQMLKDDIHFAFHKVLEQVEKANSSHVNVTHL